MLLFDLDGTLIDSNGIWETIDLKFLGRRGLVPTEAYIHTVGHSIFPIAAQFTKDYYHLDLTPDAIMAEWMEGASDAYRQVPLKAGAKQFLEQCQAQGERIALLTACVPELCRIALGCHGLTDYFETILFAEELGLEKRNPEIFPQMATRLKVPLTDCTLYEDAPANCAAAKAAGMTVVGVYDRFYGQYEAEMRTVCDQYIHSFTELLS